MSDPKHPRLVVAVVLTTLAVVAYGSSLGGGFLNWDDPTYVQNNHELRDPGGLWAIFSTFHFANYNPLHRLSYWIEWQCFGGNATVFRVTNLALHLGNALLLFALLRTWKSSYGVALAAAALFTVHPANVETVAWISERKTLLATGFAFASTILWLRERRALALLLFTAGMLCKTSIVVLPVLLIVIDLARRMEWRGLLGWYAAFFVPAIALGITQVSAAAANEAVRPLHGGSLTTHVATIVAVLPSYLVNLVFPFGLTPRHAFAAATLTDGRFFLGVILLATVAWGIVRSWRGERRFAPAALWCLAALALTLIVPIPIILADRYWYFAMPLLLAVGVEWVATRAFPQPRLGHVLAVIGAGLLAVTTLVYAGTWRDSTRLWSHALAHNPGDVEAWISLGAARHAVGDGNGALQAYCQAVQLAPTNPEALESLAGVELAQGRLQPAQQRLARLLEAHPERGKARAMLAATFDLAGDAERARQEFARGLANDPNDVTLLLNYVNFCERHRKQGEARRALEAFVEKHPGHAPARDALFRLSGAAKPGH